MAKLNIDMVVKTEYRIVFFPFATHKRVGDCELLTILGMPVYQRVGDTKRYLNLFTKRPAQDAT